MIRNTHVNGGILMVSQPVQRLRAAKSLMLREEKDAKMQENHRVIDMIMLGNLSVKDMESRAGVSFPSELIEYMESRRQHKADSVDKGEWHCFDLPFTLLCGDECTAKEIYKHLSPMADKFKEKMSIAVG